MAQGLIGSVANSAAVAGYPAEADGATAKVDGRSAAGAVDLGRSAPGESHKSRFTVDWNSSIVAGV